MGLYGGGFPGPVVLGLPKDLPITERLNLRLNPRPEPHQLAAPATQIDNTATFGQLTAPTVAENADNRTGQVALRLEF